MIPLAIPNLDGNEAKYLQDCIDSGFVSSVGAYVTRFEEDMCKASGAKFAIATSSGTTGLHAALVAVGVGHNDLVLAPSLTFIASCNAIAHCGATPWLLDVDQDSWNIDVNLLKTTLLEEAEKKGAQWHHKASGRRIAAILPVFTLGSPANMDPILAMGKDYGLPVVVDAAAALGATYRGAESGALGAAFTMYSFNGNKTVTAGGGGAVVTDDPQLADRLRHLTTTARVGADYTHDMVGFNYRMTNIQAAVGCAQLERLSNFVERKRQISDRYNQELVESSFGQNLGLSAFADPSWGNSTCWFSGFVLPESRASESPAICQSLRDHQIDGKPFWKPMHHQAPFANAPRSSMDVSDSLWKRIVTLPCSSGLTEDEQARVIDVVKTIL